MIHDQLISFTGKASLTIDLTRQKIYLILAGRTRLASWGRFTTAFAACCSRQRESATIATQIIIAIFTFA